MLKLVLFTVGNALVVRARVSRYFVFGICLLILSLLIIFSTFVAFFVVRFGFKAK